MHTPGPWTITKNPHTRLVFVAGYPLYRACPDGLNDERRKEADARLIAAAPDLLAACQRLVTLIDESDQWSDVVSGTAMGEIVNEARTAVAKAEGK